MADLQQEPKNIFLNFIPYLPLVTIGVLGYGIVKQVTYYNSFSLNILQFYDTSEILPRSLYDFIIILAILIVTFLVYYLQLTIAQLLYPKPKNPSEPKVKLYLVSSIILFILALTGIIIIVNILPNYGGFKNFRDYRITIQNIIQFVFLTLLVAICFFIAYKQINYDKIVILGSLLALNCFAISLSEGYIKSIEVKQTHVYTNSYIIIGGKKISSTNTFYYIGQTKSNLFYYNEKLKSITIYPIGLITEINLTAK